MGAEFRDKKESKQRRAQGNLGGAGEYLKIAAVVALCVFLLSKLVTIGYQIFSFSSQDGVNISVKVIDDLAHGNNPYGTDWLYDESALPSPYYESGFFHVLPAAFLTKLLGIPAALASGITQLVYVALALLAMYLCVKTWTGDTVLALLSAAVFHSCLRANLVDCFRPDTLCALLIVTIFLLVIRSEKSACGISEWLTALCGVLLIFLKIHYASILAALFLYYCKKKRWLPWGLKFAACGIVITVLTQIFFPTFFSTFGIRVIEMMRDNNADSDIRYMLDQWKTLLKKFWPLFGMILFGCIWNVRKYRRLLEDSFSFLLTVNLLVNVAALCYMGKWNGNYINYHYIMIMSSVILAAAGFLHSFAVGGAWKKLLTEGGILVYALFVACSSFVSLAGSLARLPDILAEHEQEVDFFDSYQSEDMLLDPSYAYYTYTNGIYQWDYMDQIYIPYDIGTSPRWNFLFPYTNLYRQRCIAYGEVMVQKIKNREYSIITQNEEHPLGQKLGLESEFQEAIEENYEKHQWKDIEYWIPKEG